MPRMTVDTRLPEMCFVFIPEARPGKFIGAIKRGQKGYFETDYAERDKEKAKALVTFMNEKLGVTDKASACMQAGSIFGWAAHGAQLPPDKPKVRKPRGKAARKAKTEPASHTEH